MTGTPSLAPESLFANDFRVIRQLGRGGMGAVYEVEQLSTGKRRALKLMHPQLVADDRSHERFIQEARAGAHIDSDHVVEVIGAGVDEATHTPWLAMELLDGETLAERLARLSRFSREETLEIVQQLGHALSAAHDNGLVHRDLKPENIFLSVPRRQDVRFTLKILDFGIAKLLQDGKHAGTTTAGVGTPLWMAPEQTDAGKIRPSTDVWALGLLVYTMLTGKIYWKTPNTEGGTVNGLLIELVVEPLEVASVRAAQFGVAEHLPPGFDAWFARCVVREMNQRYGDTRQAVAALCPILGGEAAAADTNPEAFAETLPSGPQGAATVPTVAGSSTTAPVALPAAPQRKRALGLWIGLAVGVLGVVAVAFAAGLGLRNGAAAPSEASDHVVSVPPPTAEISPVPTAVDAATSQPRAADAAAVTIATKTVAADRVGRPEARISDIDQPRSQEFRRVVESRCEHDGVGPQRPSIRLRVGDTGSLDGILPPRSLSDAVRRCITMTGGSVRFPPGDDRQIVVRLSLRPGSRLTDAQRGADQVRITQLKRNLENQCRHAARNGGVSSAVMIIDLDEYGSYRASRFRGTVPDELRYCLNMHRVVQFPRADTARSHMIRLSF